MASSPRRSRRSPSPAICSTCSATLSAGERPGTSPRGQCSHPADRRNDGRRCLRTLPRSPPRPGGSPLGRCGTDYQALGEGAGPPGLRHRPDGRHFPARAADRARPRGRLAVRGDRRRIRPDRAAAASGWSIRSTAPATICAAAPAGRLGRPGRGPRGPLSACSPRRPASEHLDRRARARAPGATASGSGSAARTELAGARVPADSLPRGRPRPRRWSPSPIRSRCASPWSPPARPICVATLRWGREWDIAAAALIAAEAGATVTGALGQPLAFNSPDGRGVRRARRDPGIHAAAVERLRERAMAVV